MKKLAALLLSALFLLPLTACRTKETASRAETVQERYAALTSYTAAAAVELADEEENVRYTLRFDADAEETKVTVLAPELLAGVTAHLAADTLKLEYDGPRAPRRRGGLADRAQRGGDRIRRRDGPRPAAVLRERGGRRNDPMYALVRRGRRAVARGDRGKG